MSQINVCLLFFFFLSIEGTRSYFPSSSIEPSLKRANTNSSQEQLNKELLSAAKAGQLHQVKALIRKGADLKATNKDGWTPLHYAARYGHLDVVKFLIDKGADVKATNKYGRTPLHYAARAGKLDVVKFLIDKGVKVGIHDMIGE